MGADTANSDKSAKRVIGRPFKPGQSGNPSGRPKKEPLSEYLRKRFEDPLAVKELLDAALMAAKENPAYFREIFERVEGKVAQALEVTGADGGPLLIDDLSAGRERVRQWREKNGKRD